MSEHRTQDTEHRKQDKEHRTQRQNTEHRTQIDLCKMNFTNFFFFFFLCPYRPPPIFLIKSAKNDVFCKLENL